MRRRHPASLGVGDPSGQQAGLARIGLTLAIGGVAGKPCVHCIPKFLGHDRLMFARIDLVAVGDLTAVEAIGEKMIERSEEHTSELQSLMRHSTAVFSLKKTKED